MNVRLLVVPYDSGMRGKRMGAGPQRLLDAGIVEQLKTRASRVAVEVVELPEEFFPAEVPAAFELNRQLATAVKRAAERDEFPLVLSGNCNLTLGVLAGLASDTTGIVWFDAHGDFNTPETTLTGFLDGMALAIATGRCWKEAVATIDGFKPVADEKVVLAGARDLDPGEENLLQMSAVQRVSAAEMNTGFSNALSRQRRRCQDVHVHVDLDVLDKSEGSANSYATGGGLTVTQLKSAIGEIAGIHSIRAAAITAYDPSCDVDGNVAGIAIMIALSLVRANADRPQ